MNSRSNRPAGGVSALRSACSAVRRGERGIRATEDFRRVRDRVRIDPEVAGQHPEEAFTTGVFEREVRVRDRSRFGALCHRVVTREHVRDERADPLFVALGEVGRDVDREHRIATAPASPDATEEPSGSHSPRLTPAHDAVTVSVSRPERNKRPGRASVNSPWSTISEPLTST